MEGLVAYITGMVPAGFPSPALDHAQKRIDLNEELMPNSTSSFLIRVDGDSMIDAFIPPQALLVVDRSVRPQHGNIVLAVLNGEFTVKRLVKTHAGIFLAPENPQFKPIHVKEEMNMVIWGVVTFIITDAR
ncbi:MAG TPA: translesion error-prone DNA polymerase V autoproteolytic subunit, partial [Cyclobacteriaceae bacterium]|nr:translesion error-prone DNA polymerase V autoproteolytic subunit [Cyclobacteriaceae bacterium]